MIIIKIFFEFRAVPTETDGGRKRVFHIRRAARVWAFEA